MAAKLAVSNEPGLTNAQLMLTNHDLKPGMSKPEEPQIHSIDTIPQSNLSGDSGALGILLASGSRIRSTLYAERFVRYRQELMMHRTPG